MRSLRVLPFLAAAVSGCSDLSTFEGTAKALIEAQKDLADVLDGITDAESAEAARPALLRIAKRESDVWAALKTLGEPSGDDERKVRATLDASLDKVLSRVRKNLERLRAVPRTRGVIAPIWDEYRAAADPRSFRFQVVRLRMHKEFKLREIFRHLLTERKVPMKGGALDVYGLVRSGTIGRDEYSLFREGQDGPPSDEEIERGDYTNFPYDRYRGESDLDPTRSVPLLWDKEPDVHGVFVVGLSTGFVEYMDKDELTKTLGK